MICNGHTARVCSGFVPAEMLVWGVQQLATEATKGNMLKTTMAVPSRSAAARELHRLVSYNVLSPHLCSPDYFVHCKPRDLEPQLRLKRVKEKLQPHVQQQAIVCLQVRQHMLCRCHAETSYLCNALANAST